MKIQSTKQEILFHSTALNVDIIPHIISCEYLTEHKNVFLYYTAKPYKTKQTFRIQSVSLYFETTDAVSTEWLTNTYLMIQYNP